MFTHVSIANLNTVSWRVSVLPLKAAAKTSHCVCQKIRLAIGSASLGKTAIRGCPIPLETRLSMNRTTALTLLNHKTRHHRKAAHARISQKAYLERITKPGLALAEISESW